MSTLSNVKSDVNDLVVLYIHWILSSVLNLYFSFNFNILKVSESALLRPEVLDYYSNSKESTKIRKTFVSYYHKSGMVKVQLESPHFLNVLTEAMDRIFKKPSSIFVTMKAIEFIDAGIPIDCNHTDFSSKRVCAELRKNSAIKVMNDEKTLLRFRWFDKVTLTIYYNERLSQTYTLHATDKRFDASALYGHARW